MTNTACSVIDLESYRELRRTSPFDRFRDPLPASHAAAQPSVPAFEPPAPDLSESLSLLGRELRNAELRLIDLAATIDELYAQVDEMARR